MKKANTVSKPSLTELIKEKNELNVKEIDHLLPELYTELKKIAKVCLRNERKYHTLQATALVNEAFLKLLASNKIEVQNRKHFYSISAQIMRHLLIDHARGKGRLKRGDKAVHLSFDEKMHWQEGKDIDVEALEIALNQLEKLDPRRAKVVELRFFCGLNIDEVADVLETSPTTIKRDWSFARAWLYRELFDKKTQ